MAHGRLQTHLPAMFYEVPSTPFVGSVWATGHLRVPCVYIVLVDDLNCAILGRMQAALDPRPPAIMSRIALLGVLGQRLQVISIKLSRMTGGELCFKILQ